jgi:hypothetical protein
MQGKSIWLPARWTCKLKHAGTPYLLKGKLFDSTGSRMTPSHSVKKGVR